MAVGIEPEAMSEARLPRELLFGHALDVIDESAVRLIQLPQNVGEGKAPFLFRHLRIEGIDAAGQAVSRWPTSCDDERQILQRLLLPVLATWVIRSKIRDFRRNDFSLRSNCSLTRDAGSLSP
jgi:hypothetical protein